MLDYFVVEEGGRRFLHVTVYTRTTWILYIGFAVARPKSILLNIFRTTTEHCKENYKLTITFRALNHWILTFLSELLRYWTFWSKPLWLDDISHNLIWY